MGWGSSPDGLLYDDDMDWSKVPESISKYYTLADQLDIDPHLGVLEIKSSQSKMILDPSYFPQVRICLFCFLFCLFYSTNHTSM